MQKSLRLAGALEVVGRCGAVSWRVTEGAGCVMYYGMPVEKAEELAPLQADVLGIFAKQEKWINEEVIGNFEALAKATGKKLDSHWFDADHAFANPTSSRYHEESAQKANAMALTFLKEKLQ